MSQGFQRRYGEDEAMELIECELFEDLPEQDLEQVRHTGGIVEIDEGDVLFERGDQGEELYLILEGMVQVTIPDELSDKDITLALLAPGEILGEMAVLTGKDRSADAEAVRPSRLFAMRGEVFHELTDERPELAVNLSKILGKRLWETDSEMQRVAFNTLRSRLAAQLLRLGEKFGKEVADGLKIDFELTHGMLADLVGTYRETITKKISKLKEKDVLGEADGQILIKQPDRLKRISKG